MTYLKTYLVLSSCICDLNTDNTIVIDIPYIFRGIHLIHLFTNKQEKYPVWFCSLVFGFDYIDNSEFTKNK